MKVNIDMALLQVKEYLLIIYQYYFSYLDNKVFVSLANGDLIVYKRDTEGIWDTENPYTRTSTYQ